MDDLISRQAAIDEISKRIKSATNWANRADDSEIKIRAEQTISAFCEASLMLKSLPSAQPVEDIHREKEQAYYCGYEDGAKVTRSELTSVQERKKGRWIHDGYDFFPNGIDWIHCSVCGKRWINIPADLPNYCPCCGAEMEGAEE